MLCFLRKGWLKQQMALSHKRYQQKSSVLSYFSRTGEDTAILGLYPISSVFGQTKYATFRHVSTAPFFTEICCRLFSNLVGSVTFESTEAFIACNVVNPNGKYQLIFFWALDSDTLKIFEYLKC